VAGLSVHHLNYRTGVPGDPEKRSRFPVHEVGRNEDVFDVNAGRILYAGSVITSESLHLHSNGLDTRARLEFAFEFHPKGYEPKYSGFGGGVAGNTVR